MYSLACMTRRLGQNGSFGDTGISWDACRDLCSFTRPATILGHDVGSTGPKN